MVNFIIIFDRSDRKYNPGDRINLEVRVQAHSETKFRSIYARIQGFAHVEWTESRQVERDGKSHTEYTTYYADETYFKKYQTLAGAERGSDQRLSAGSHVYHASFQLPQNLPQTYEADVAHIRYEAKVHMDVPWGLDDKEKTSFLVNPHFDLNEYRHLNEPVRAKAQKTFGCCCWESEPLSIYNVLPRLGFVPGDRVPYTLELNNDSDVSIDSASVKFVEKIFYHTHSPCSDTRDKDRTLWQHEFYIPSNQLVAAMQNKVFTTNLHFDPSWSFKCFNGCGIINVEYYLKSEAHTSGCHTNLSNHTSITMGTIPFANQGAYLTPMAPMYSNVPIPNTMPFPSAPSDIASAPMAPEIISEQPLPSYNDTVSKPSILPGEIGWTRTNHMETPPPTFTEFKLTENKEKPKEKQ